MDAIQEAPPERQRLENNFDLLRLLASGLVLYWHSFVLTGHMAQEPFYRLSGGSLNPGGLGVKCFFVISGFLVCGSLLRARSFTDFALRRALRILPALGAVLLGSVLLIGPLTTTLSQGAYWGDGRTWLYLTNFFCTSLQLELPGCFAGNPGGPGVNGALWTLPLEVACYAGLALLGASTLLRRGLGAWLALGLTVALDQAARSPAGALLPPRVLWLPTSELLTLAPLFAAGMCLHQLRDRLPRSRTAATLCVLVLLAALPTGQIDRFFLPCGCYLLFWLAHAPLGRMAAFSRRADLSYGIFLWGAPLQQCLALADPLGLVRHPFLFAAASVPLVVPAALASWFLIEKPAQELKRLLPRAAGMPLAERPSGTGTRLADLLLLAGTAALAFACLRPFVRAGQPELLSSTPLVFTARPELPEGERILRLQVAGRWTQATRLRCGRELLPLARTPEGDLATILPAAVLAAPGGLDVRLEDPALGRSSSWLLLHIDPPADGPCPAIAGLEPAMLDLADPNPALHLTVIGAAPLTVLVDRVPVSATATEADGRLHLVLAGSHLAPAGLRTLRLRDGAGRLSDPVLLRVR